MKFFLSLLFVFFISNYLFSQNKAQTTVGFQYNPIFSSNFFHKKTMTQTLNNVEFKVNQLNGTNTGLEIRHDFTNRYALQTGINLTVRNFNISILDSVGFFESDFQFYSYEIPVMGLIYVRLGERLYTNNSVGFSLDFYPSDIFTTDRINYDHHSVRNSWIQGAFKVNLGLEIRTNKKGFFYIGTSYHRMIKDMLYTNIAFKDKYEIVPSHFKINGHYIALNLKYFFNPR